MRRFSSVPFSDVRITGAFWSERLDTILSRTIPSQHRMMERHGILASLKLPDPVPPLTIPRNHHDFTTQIFWDSDVGKWIEAASYALSHRRDDATEARIEAIIDDLEVAQAPDGYLNCWYLGREPDKRWTNLRDNHELYCAGHMLEGAIAYFRTTGRDRLLKIMVRYVDHIADTFGPGRGQRRGYPGHQEIEIALIKLYHLTGEVRHLDLARYFINERGREPHYFDTEAKARGDDPADFWAKTYEYNQSHMPVRAQTKVVGHAVRAMYMYTAMADLAAEDGDDSLKQACEALWDDITTKRMYVTGGFGPSAANEGFTTDYDLPNDTAYAETCASVAMVFWASRMLNLEMDGRYADILELALYNTVLAGLSQDGEHYFYDNKLESDGTHARWEWHPCPCCTMNASRLLASVAGYFFSVAEDEVAVHLYGGATAEVQVGGGTVRLSETSDYPWDGRIGIGVDPGAPLDFTLALRIPGWARGFDLAVNGDAVAAVAERGYVRISRTWAPGDQVSLDLPMAPERVFAHPDIRQDVGRVALRRGPLVYCIEQHDQTAPVHRLRLRRDAGLEVLSQADKAGPVRIAAAAEALSSDMWKDGLYVTQSSDRACGDACRNPLLSVGQPRTQPDAGLAAGTGGHAGAGPGNLIPKLRSCSTCVTGRTFPSCSATCLG